MQRAVERRGGKSLVVREGRYASRQSRFHLRTGAMKKAPCQDMGLAKSLSTRLESQLLQQ
jgi:hypothetical protein